MNLSLQRLLFRPLGGLVFRMALAVRPRRRATEDGPGGVPNRH